MPKNHKAIMKPEVAHHFINKYTNENDVILDCFFGLGTTGIVSKNNNRKFIGIEMEQSYYNIACNNLYL